MIPDWLTLPGLGWVLGASAFLGWPRVADAFLGVSLCGGLLLISAVISRGSIGGGDVKLMAVIGASLGWQWGFGVLVFAQLFAALVALCFFIAGRRGTERYPSVRAVPDSVRFACHGWPPVTIGMLSRRRHPWASTFFPLDSMISMAPVQRPPSRIEHTCIGISSAPN